MYFSSEVMMCMWYLTRVVLIFSEWGQLCNDWWCMCSYTVYRCVRCNKLNSLYLTSVPDGFNNNLFLSYIIWENFLLFMAFQDKMVVYLLLWLRNWSWRIQIEWQKSWHKHTMKDLSGSSRNLGPLWQTSSNHTVSSWQTQTRFVTDLINTYRSI